MISFQQALQHTENSTRHLLLGNGFSMDCNLKNSEGNNIFNYKSILDKINLKDHNSLNEIFRLLKTANFERSFG